MSATVTIHCRCLVVALVATTAAAAVVGSLTGGLGAPVRDSADGVARLCTLAVLGAVAWGWVAILSGAVEAWRGAAAPGSTGVRRWVLAACGAAVSTALVPAAGHADPAPVPPATTGQVTVLVARAEPTVEVRPGDCLWSIAAEELPPGAGPRTVTARWRLIYRANRREIGPDPDLIRPGQRLRLPR